MIGLRSAGLAAAAVMFVLAAGLAEDPPADEFSATGPLATGPRSNHASVLLADGRVLVVGGHGTGDGSSLATAEVYDPLAGTWSAAGTMSTGRGGATASLLPDGRVLVAGGSSLAPMFSSTEIWDPETLSFSSGPSMSVARGGHVAVTLTDGRVLVAGGMSVTANPPAIGSAEIYDPASNSWSPTGAMVQARANHAAVRLPDGRVLVAGGDGGSPAQFKGTTGCQIYDPAAGTFSAAASMAAKRGNHALALLGDGRVMAVGGNKNATGTPVHEAEIYDPGTDAWTSAGTTGSGGTLPTLTVLADGRALAAGGQALADAPCDLADVFDPVTGAFSPLSPMPGVRLGHSATLLADGTVLVAGGYTNFTTYPYWTADCAIFTPGVPPAAPEGFEVTGTGASAISLAWTHAGGGGVSFELERALEGGDFAPAATLEPGATSHTDSGLPPATVHRYRLRAVSDFGASAWTGEASARTESTLSLLEAKGSVTDSVKPLKDRLAFRADVAFGELSPDGQFTADAGIIAFRLGSPAGPVEFLIPTTGDGWTLKKDRLLWKSPRGTLPKLKLEFPLVGGPLRVKASGFDFPSPPTAATVVELVAGDDGIHMESEWRARGTGKFSHP